jgi:hypothetical protein
MSVPVITAEELRVWAASAWANYLRVRDLAKWHRRLKEYGTAESCDEGACEQRRLSEFLESQADAQAGHAQLRTERLAEHEHELRTRAAGEMEAGADGGTM